MEPQEVQAAVERVRVAAESEEDGWAHELRDELLVSAVVAIAAGDVSNAQVLALSVLEVMKIDMPLWYA